MKYILCCLCLAFFAFENASPKEESKVFSLPKLFLNFVKNKGEYVLEKSGGNSQCAKDLKMLLSDFIFAKRWALEMIDATAKPPSGMMHGHYAIPGNFDQCVNIREEKNDTSIQGKYCTVIMMPNSQIHSEFSILFDPILFSSYMGFTKSERYQNILKTVKISYGLCIPKSCSIENLQTIWDYLEHSLKIPVHAAFVELLCSTKDKEVEPYKYIDETIITLFSLYIILLIICTLYDILGQRDPFEEKRSIWLSFSMYTNSKKLFSHNSDSENLTCINGIKVLSTMWVILGHRFLINGFLGPTNAVYLFEWNKTAFSAFIYSAFLAVDTFFTLSGLVISYGYMKYHDLLGKDGKINYAMFYFYRILRLTPALLATILFYTTIFKKLGDGPAWPVLAKKFGATCLSSGWATLLFLTNFLTLDKQCVEQSWYIAVDTHLYIIAPVLLINLLKNTRKTLIVCVVSCLISAFYTFFTTMINNYGPFIYDSDLTYYRNVYNSTFVRMPPWLIGFVCGYMIFKYQHKKLSKVVVAITWIISLATILFIMSSHMAFTTHGYSTMASAIYNSCAKPLWGVAISLITFLCVSGHGGKINKFLSLPVFQILVKISYSVLLIHLLVLFYFTATRRQTEYFSNIKGLHDFAGDLIFTFIAATLWCLAFESPFIAIAKHLYKKDKTSDISSEIQKHNIIQETMETSNTESNTQKEKDL